MKDEIKKVIKEMILDGDIKLAEVNKEVYSNEGRYYGDETLYVLEIDGEQQDYLDGLSIDRPEITGW